MFTLTKHAWEQCQIRDIRSDTVLAVVNRKSVQIRQFQSDYEVKVIIGRLSVKVFLPDGSNGDTVLACVDPRNNTVKTVMFQRWAQVSRKMQSEAYV